MDGVYLIESLIIDNERGSIAPKEFEKVPNGSWWGSLRVESNEIWSLIQQGKLRGFSVEGMFGQDKSRNIQEKIINKIRDVISNYKKI
jgi:hypothetical protein